MLPAIERFVKNDNIKHVHGAPNPNTMIRYLPFTLFSASNSGDFFTISKELSSDIILSTCPELREEFRIIFSCNVIHSINIYMNNYFSVSYISHANSRNVNPPILSLIIIVIMIITFITDNVAIIVRCVVVSCH